MNEIEKALHKLKLPGMSTCWTSLCETHRVDKLSFRDDFCCKQSRTPVKRTV
jgi:hypothetical protein